MPVDASLDGATGEIQVRYKDKKGVEKLVKEKLDVPPGVANGMVFTLLKNIAPTTPETVIPMVAAGPKPRVVSLLVSPAGEDSFTIGGSSRKATHYVVKVKIGGIAGIVAPIIGKQPPDSHVWIMQGDAPAFVKSEGPLAPDGPVVEDRARQPDVARADEPEAVSLESSADQLRRALGRLLPEGPPSPGGREDGPRLAEIPLEHAPHVGADGRVDDGEVELEVEAHRERIEVARSDEHDRAVGDRRLGVDHDAFPLEDARPGVEQSFVDPSRGGAGNGMVVSPWKKQAHRHAALRRILEGIDDGRRGDHVRVGDLQRLSSGPRHPLVDRGDAAGARQILREDCDCGSVHAPVAGRAGGPADGEFSHILSKARSTSRAIGPRTRRAVSRHPPPPFSDGDQLSLMQIPPTNAISPSTVSVLRWSRWRRRSQLHGANGDRGRKGRAVTPARCRTAAIDPPRTIMVPIGS